MGELSTEPDARQSQRIIYDRRLPATAKVSAEDLVRIGPFMTLPSALKKIGVSPKLAFRKAGISLQLFNNAENRLKHEAIDRLLCVCATLSQRDDFGVLVGEQFTLADFGILGELMRNSATVGEALQILAFHFRYQDRAGIPIILKLDKSSAFLGYSLQYPALPGTPHIYDLSIAIAQKILHELCGPAWQPGLVQLSHRRHRETTHFRRVFGPHVRFDAGLSGIAFPASWLNHHITGACPTRFTQLNQALLKEGSGRTTSFTEEVQSIVHQQLISGACSSRQVARLLSISERTLRHKLKSEGTSLQRILKEIRLDLARHLLRNTRLPMSEIAAVLCFSDAAVFSRAFHQWAGTSPRQWRQLSIKG